ncbi:RNA polymerase sigma factor [Armatimonas rosea]|uniref:RNA polymerase sigma-70 factor (ECF subfamily) n=1 Tax=Armatimonas rosea TaxID=685828 RepID=A0A7W9SQA5_ARMRO|nr:RNA polymerase sigma factor [Armatimonas rosea]MBB6050862.1 RNA polymerase sigma-70 factor (ECF subfamily) [Armatimonas rosea]
MNLWREKRLLLAFRRRDPSAFDTLFARHAGAVLGFALRLTRGCHAEAEELVSETFVAAFQNAERFRGSSRLTTYLLGITLNRWRDRRRKASLPTVPLLDHDGPIPETNSLLTLAIHEAARELELPQREAFQLVVVEGFTHKEAAQLLEIPLGTLKWRVAEAVRHVRLALEEPK